MKRIRCAIYTRKSSEEGLEQDFNSLHAQRAACEAYVMSQASEGWWMLPDVYDDGGLSGGSLNRPALQRLLGDIEAGKIDIVVVYKVDRLTRSLLDFAKLVEAFDAANTSFVSVTQSFNTTTSMGRLTLNMLLSFAQFEREVTAERIRDKIAASKARGMWMGGNPPIGYRPDGRSLAIVEPDAELIRQIFGRYLEAGNVWTVVQQLRSDGLRKPVRYTTKGRAFGGGHFLQGEINRILKNRLYIGEIAHRDQIYPARHQAIIDRPTWNEAQQLLGAHRRGDRTKTAAAPSLLAGLINDESGEALIASHSCKGARRYRYYISRHLELGNGRSNDSVRVPAREIESVVCERLAAALSQPLNLLNDRKLSVAHLQRALKNGPVIAKQVLQQDRETVRALVTGIVVMRSGVAISVSRDRLGDMIGCLAEELHDSIEITVEVQITRSGRVVRMVEPNGRSAVAREPDAVLIKLVARAYVWWARLCEGEIDIAQLAKAEGISASYATRVLRLAFLAPPIVEAILEGRQLPSIDAKTLTLKMQIANDWKEQRQMMLPASPN